MNDSRAMGCEPLHLLSPGPVGSILNAGGIHTSPSQPWLKDEALENIYFLGKA